MTWTNLTNIDVTNGSATVSVNQSINLQPVRSGWGLYINETGELLEIASGNNHSGGVATLTLAGNYPGTTATGRTASVVPLSASTQALLQQFDASTALIAQYTSQFPTLSGVEQDMALLVDASGNGFEVVPGSEFLQRTGLNDALQDVFSDPDQAIIDAAKAGAQSAAGLAEQWASEDEDVVVSNGEYSAKHYSIKAAEFSTAAQGYSVTAQGAIAAATAQADLAQQWAEEDEDVEVTTGLYSAKHYSAKAQAAQVAAESAETNTVGQVALAQQWAAETVDVVVSGGMYSAFHYSTKAGESAALAAGWAETAEDIEVTTGQYSALHHAAKASASADAAAASLAALGSEVADAEAAATLSEQWASEDEDVVVSGGEYSSKHHAAKAAASATAAGTSETNAAAHEAAADADRIAAETAETNAETAQTAAETARAGAETAETNAETAQAAAETAQGLSEAARNAAQLAETNAETAKTNAEAAQTAAEAARDLSQTYSLASARTAMFFEYDTTTTGGDPGNGVFRFNDADLTAATALYIDDLNAAGADVSDWLATWDDSSTPGNRGQLLFINANDASIFAVFRITGANIPGAGYRTIQVAYVDHSGAFTDADNFSVEFYRAGDKGVDGLGSGDVIGPASSTDGNVALFDGATGKLIQDGGFAPQPESQNLTDIAGQTFADGDFIQRVAGVLVNRTVAETKAALGLDNVVNVDTTDAGNISSGTLASARLPASIDADTTGTASTASAWSTARTINLGGDLSGSVALDGSANVTLNAEVANDSHTHSLDNLTGKNGGTGNYSTSGDIESGRGSGGVALTINDSQGNANVTFNHSGGTPEQDGNAARIMVNTDASENAAFTFELKSNVTGGIGVNTTPVMDLNETRLLVYNALVVNGAMTRDGNTVYDDSYHPEADNADALGGQVPGYYLDYLNFTNTPTIPDTESIQDLVGAMFSGNTETRITATYQDGDGTIDLVVNVTAADVGLGNVANVDTTNATNISAGTLSAARLPATISSNTTGTAAALTSGVKNSIEIDSGDLQLDGDEASPGNNKVYGTDSTGTKGWQTQTFVMSGLIATPEDKDYRLFLNLPFGFTILSTSTRSSSGTCTATFKINSTALGGTANSVSSTESTQSHASSNTGSSGDDVVLTVSSNSDCEDLSFTIKYTRDLA